MFFKAIDITSEWQKRAAYRQIKGVSVFVSHSRKKQARTRKEKCWSRILKFTSHHPLNIMLSYDQKTDAKIIFISSKNY